MPFAGPVGAVRVAQIDGQLVVNPSLPAMESGNDLDLIVVGSKEGLTMVEAGADQVPEDRLLEALEIAHEEIKRICAAQEELRELAGKPKWLDPEKTEELKAAHGAQITAKIGEVGLRDAGSFVDELQSQVGGEISMDSTEDDVIKRTQARSSFTLLLEGLRLDAVKAPVREQFEAELQALTDAEQDSKELKSAKRALLYDRIVETVSLPFPGGEDGEKDSLTKQFVKKACDALYKELVRTKIAVDKRRPDGRGAEEIRPITCDVERLAAHARLRPLHPRPDADHVAPHARHREGGSAHRRPLPRGGAPLHAPLQLPALLGRRDRVHAGPEAA